MYKVPWFDNVNVQTINENMYVHRLSPVRTDVLYTLWSMYICIQFE